MTEDDVFTVHPFDNEWELDLHATKSGSHPWATKSLREAIDHANLVRLEYASVEDVDPEWLAGFWSAIYDESAGPEGAMIGWVDPEGNYIEGPHPSATE